MERVLECHPRKETPRMGHTWGIHRGNRDMEIIDAMNQCFPVVLSKHLTTREIKMHFFSFSCREHLRVIDVLVLPN